MKKTSTADILYSPSDLVTFIRSPFASWMDRLAIETPEAVEDIDTLKDPMMDLLGDKGSKHEHSYLEKLIQQYGEENVAIITGKGDQGIADTHAAMKAGHPVIFQAALQRENFQGYADFLIKCDGKSKLGEYYYEAWDTKLAKSTRPYFLIQLCAYSWMLEEFQDKRPDEAAIVLGDGTIDQYRISGYYNYFKNALQQFL